MTMEHMSPCLSGWLSQRGSGLSGALTSDLDEIARHLLRRGILTTSTRHGKPVRPAIIPRAHESLGESDTKLPWRSTMRFSAAAARSLIWASRRLSHHALLSTIRTIVLYRDHDHRFQARPDISRISALIAAFNSWRGFASRPNACLYDSLAALHFLTQYEIFPSLIFGVVAEPFQAHCWLQYDGLILNDSLSHVIDYTPIMLV
ncbi:MAG: lasso peptide biosynthesis B2 protein [Proteobacteria bacterium]|nr:lasso peptide biosynthesis B2 protein [Pseudomonadota bacterium]